MSTNASFDTYVTIVTNKSRQKSNWIIGSFHKRNLNCMKKMLLTPYIDYSSCKNTN